MTLRKVCDFANLGVTFKIRIDDRLEQVYLVEDDRERAFTGSLQDAAWYLIDWIREKKFGNLSAFDVRRLKEEGIPSHYTKEAIEEALCGQRMIKEYYTYLFDQIMNNEEVAFDAHYFIIREIAHIIKSQNLN